MQKVTEGKAIIKAQIQEIVDKKMPIFYNPDMKLNRDLSIYVLNAVGKENWKIGLPLAGSGIRGIRISKEVTKKMDVYVNDIRYGFSLDMEEAMKLNGVRLSVFNEDANLFLLKNKFDYVDVDPFGSPNPFLDSAVRSLRNKGVLSITATDTSSLSGTYPTACKRKYWAIPIRDEKMHERGIRILIRKAQLIAGQHGIALTPCYSISQIHYMKVFFYVEKGKKKVDEIFKKHEMVEGAGPLWTGNLYDFKLAEKVALQSDEKILRVIAEEAKEEKPIFDVHRLAKQNKISQIPKFEKILEKTSGTRTHFSEKCIRSNLNKEEIVKIIQQLS